MTPAERALLDRLHELHRGLSHRLVLLTHLRSDVDEFAEGLRDLGNDLSDLAAECLHRVDELDTLPVGTGKQHSHRIAVLADRLDELRLDHRIERPDVLAADEGYRRIAEHGDADEAADDRAIVASRRVRAVAEGEFDE